MSTADRKCISGSDADKLITAHDGDVALLYIWLGRAGGYNTDAAARALCRTEREIENAYEKLSRMGLADKPAGGAPREPIPLPADELPQYTAAEIVKKADSDGSFRAVIEQTEAKLGKKLSRDDLQILFGIYEHLAMPADVIFMLVSYCVDLFAEKYGPGKRPSLKAIQTEAFSWANNEIITIEQADEYIRSRRERHSRLGGLMRAMGLGVRAPVKSERKYFDEWFDMGFDDESILIAYERTIMNKKELKWSYMNAILKSWDSKGIHSAAEVAERDGGKSAASKPVKGGGKTRLSDEELSRLRETYNKVKNG